MDKRLKLNAICPYFTMFPLDFPLGILESHKEKVDINTSVFDPFCGRGTTNFSARINGLHTIGIDSNPVAVGITKAKLVNVSAEEIIRTAKYILKNYKEVSVPSGEFWNNAFAPKTLSDICRIRDSLLRNCSSEARIALNAVIMGALHGPKTKSSPSYFSNQAPRTYAPKPNYSVKYWTQNRMKPEEVDVLQLISKRAHMYFETALPVGRGLILKDNSCRAYCYRKIHNYLEEQNTRIKYLITSPPYYGLRTYIQDQWLRNWFVGGPEQIDYSVANQIKHSSIKVFTDQLRYVWKNSEQICEDNALMAIRFGAINDRLVSPEDVIRDSLANTAWQITDILPAGLPPRGRRQMETFIEKKEQRKPVEEIDVYAVLRK